jgi:hypothetical protein
MAANSLSTTHTKTFSVPSSGFFLDVRVDESRTASDQQCVEGTSHGGRTLVTISSRWHIVSPAQSTRIKPFQELDPRNLGSFYGQNISMTAARNSSLTYKSLILLRIIFWMLFTRAQVAMGDHLAETRMDGNNDDIYSRPAGVGNIHCWKGMGI